MKLKRVVFFGFLIWLILFLFRLATFTLRAKYFYLMQIIDFVVILSSVSFAIYHYDKHKIVNCIRESFIWFLVVIILDILCFKVLFKTTILDYINGYGMILIIIPLVTLNINLLLKKCKK